MLQPELTQAEIAKLAYLHWEKRGRPSDSADIDWQQAVEEVNREREMLARAFGSFSWQLTS